MYPIMVLVKAIHLAMVEIISCGGDSRGRECGEGGDD
jgi:hypothetical protein